MTQSVYDERTGRLAEQRFFDNLTAYDNGQGTPQEVWQFTYDAFGRQLRSERTLAGGAVHITAYQYDGEGRLARLSSPEGVVSYTYDNLGRQTATIVGTAANPERITSYTYDALGRLKTVVEDQQPASTADPLLTTTYSFDLVGNLRRTELPNGVITVNVFDSLHRLDVMTHYAPDATPTDLSDNAKLAEFDYTIRADGRRTGVAETFWTTAGTLTNVIAWAYDDLGRLISEDFDSSDNARAYLATYQMDLVGNRLRYTKDVGRDGAIEETVTGTFDANDRLTQEVSTSGTTTTYGYSHTQQTSKVVTQADGSSVSTLFSYDLQGRLEIGTVETRDASDTLLRRERTTYHYDHTGIRVSALNEVDANGDGTWDSRVKTAYLNAPQNFTGYSQVLRESHFDPATGQLLKTVDYTIGLDEILQTTTTFDSAGNVASRETLVFGHDGHGSVRVVIDLAGAIATVAGVQQLFLFDAYGQLLNMTPSQAGTTLLFSGEMFDDRIKQKYLRARYYDPLTGRFNRSDPFFGNIQKLKDIHKYIYTQDDPVNGIDPSGLAFEDDLSLQGIVGHWAFSFWAAVVRPGTVPGATLGTILPALFPPNSGESGLKPDLVDPTFQDFFELKPIRHRNSLALQTGDNLRMELYDNALQPHGFDRGDSFQLVPQQPGGLLIGEIATPTTTYIIKLYPADRIMQPSGFSGEGFIWYAVQETNQMPPIIPIPITESVRDYGDERIRIRVWRPEYAPVAAAALTIAALIAVGITAQQAGWNARMSTAFITSFTFGVL